MLKLGSTYLIVKDLKKSVDFYSALLEMQPTARNFDRWVQFDFHGQCIALWNPEYDNKEMSSGKDLTNLYSESYIKYHKNMDLKYGNNFVLNFYVDDLKKEYDRVSSLGIGKMTALMHINVASSYHLFVVYDPDGNQIEITGSI